MNQHFMQTLTKQGMDSRKFHDKKHEYHGVRLVGHGYLHHE